MSARIQPLSVHCGSCLYEGQRIDTSVPCPSCGGELSIGQISSTRLTRKHRKGRGCGVVGECSPELQAYIDAALARNRAEAHGG